MGEDGANGSFMVYDISNPCISEAGIVTRPKFNGENISVTVNATAYKNGFEANKEYTGENKTE